MMHIFFYWLSHSSEIDFCFFYNIDLYALFSDEISARICFDWANYSWILSLDCSSSRNRSIRSYTFMFIKSVYISMYFSLSEISLLWFCWWLKENYLLENVAEFSFIPFEHESPLHLWSCLSFVNDSGSSFILELY